MPSCSVLPSLQKFRLPRSLCADDRIWSVVASVVHCNLRLLCVKLKAHNRQKNYAKLGKHIVNLYFVLAFALALFLFLLGLISFVHLNKMRNYGAQQPEDEEAPTTYNKTAYYLLLTASIISCLIGILFFITMNISYKLTNDINAKVFKIEGMSLAVVAFSAFLVLASSAALSTTHQIGDTLEICVCNLKVLYVLGIIGIALGLVHPVVVYFEQKTHIKVVVGMVLLLSLIHICRCRRYAVCRSRWSPYH
eukprot:TRINITY_DN14865_c0_g1_i1.p1 TRINITY_DN14865_c0_g1~~TRINITY_DN14865_c0_g1_i1.p1  ORF type:complete len:250 (-),score=0.28 TRINITY_DN14865_c0_g1_i1:22-771(-)